MMILLIPISQIAYLILFLVHVSFPRRDDLEFVILYSICELEMPILKKMTAPAFLILSDFLLLMKVQL